MALSAAAPSEICVSKIPVLLNPVFIADLHLSNDKPATKEAFLKFLKTDAARFSELVILGDLFEFWAGDDMAEQYADVINALKQYFSGGHRIYLMHGNRDFLLGADFAASIARRFSATRSRFRSAGKKSSCLTAMPGARLITIISSSEARCATRRYRSKSSRKN